MSENGWNISARPSDLHSKCAERHLENKTNFRGEHVFFISLGFIAEKTNEFCQPFFCIFDKTAFCVSRAQFDIFVRIFFHFFYHFRDLKNFFTFSTQIFQRICLKCIYTCTDDHLMKNGIFAEKCNCFSSLWLLSKTYVGFLEEKVRYGYQNCIVHVQKTIQEGNAL